MMKSVKKDNNVVTLGIGYSVLASKIDTKDIIKISRVKLHEVSISAGDYKKLGGLK